MSPDYDAGANTGSGFLYADFGLGRKGDVLFLSDPEGNIIQRMDIPELTSDISYGFLEGSFEPVYFSNPTPGMPNDEKAARLRTVQALFFQPGAVFTLPRFHCH